MSNNTPQQTNVHILGLPPGIAYALFNVVALMPLFFVALYSFQNSLVPKTNFLSVQESSFVLAACLCWSFSLVWFAINYGANAVMWTLLDLHNKETLKSERELTDGTTLTTLVLSIISPASAATISVFWGFCFSCFIAISLLISLVLQLLSYCLLERMLKLAKQKESPKP